MPSGSGFVAVVPAKAGTQSVPRFMFAITAGSGFGTAAAVLIASRRLFDERERLRVDRLSPPRK